MNVIQAYSIRYEVRAGRRPLLMRRNAECANDVITMLIELINSAVTRFRLNKAIKSSGTVSTIHHFATTTLCVVRLTPSRCIYRVCHCERQPEQESPPLCKGDRRCERQGCRTATSAAKNLRKERERERDANILST